MSQLLDCVVSYFGLDENEQPGYRRYFCYHLVAAPGPSAGAALASITTLALHDETQRCNYCQNLHTVEIGGPAAALTAAIDYLDAFHEGDHVRKVQSDIRGLQNGLSIKPVPSFDTRIRPSQGRGISTRKG